MAQLKEKPSAYFKPKSIIRTMIVEDFTLVRIGLISALEAFPDIKVVGETGCAESSLKMISENKPDLVLMDLELDNMDGITATKKIKEIDPNIKVLILTSYQDEDKVVAAFASGANGYCLKDTAVERLVDVIHGIVEGGTWLDPKVANVALKIFSQVYEDTLSIIKPQQAALYPLSPRELQILQLVAYGRSNADIGKELFISVHTVKAAVCNILQKLCVDDRIQAAVKAVQSGLVEGLPNSYFCTGNNSKSDKK